VNFVNTVECDFPKLSLRGCPWFVAVDSKTQKRRPEGRLSMLKV
jgi:hypothetical protein